ncbi:MAG TPA: PVC-type heme-binding CxxCH protein [Pirellulaceae bacterium]
MLLGHSGGYAADGFPRVPPTPPEKAEATFEVQHGFRMDLIAAEPLVVDPVDLAYDELGRAYVIEMRDYPYPEEKNAAPTVFPGTVRLIEDTDGDGKFDKATIFADQLAWPTSVCCYKGGVFVAAAPDIWYFKDNNGDGKADERRKVFTGFSRYNVQAIMNSLRWGLDNKIYGSASGNGGTVGHVREGTVREGEAPAEPAAIPTRSVSEGRANEAIQLTRRDFRFDPVTEKIEAISGGERYGACFDDWGNRFLCNIRNPVQHVVLPLAYMQRNPNLIVPSFINDCAESGDQLRVYRLSPPEAWREFRAQRWALEGANMPRSETIGAGFWTSSSGVCVYRGAAYPEPFRGNVFIGEVAGNLIHRQILERDGVTFKSRRADENTEFVRSRDNWFRPVNFINAPDGTLTVLDMYRETIEHPWSIPDDIKAQLDLSSGNDRGRLYRLAPPAFSSQKPPNLANCTTAELVAHLENPNSWYRETAQRLLFERQDKNAAEPLRQLARRSLLPQCRLHSAWLLEGLNSLDQESLSALLVDSSADVIRHAVILAEPRARNDGQIFELIYRQRNHPEPAVQLQIVFTSGEIGKENRKWRDYLLHNAAAFYSNDPWIRLAIVSSLAGNEETLAELLISGAYADAQSPDAKGRLDLIRMLATAVGARGDTTAVGHMMQSAGLYAFPKYPGRGFAALTGLGEGLARRRQKFPDQIAKLPAHSAGILRNLLREVAVNAGDHKRSEVERTAALQLLAFLDWHDAKQSLVTALSPSESNDVQRTALRSLASFNEPAVAPELLSRWKQLTPPLRDEAVTILLSRPIWHEPLIAALETGDVPISQVSIPQRTRLAAIKDEKLAERAKEILASFALGPRKEVLDRYQESLSLKGDTNRGQAVYRRECLNCHKLRSEGSDVGPSLETVQHRSPPEILIHVLDPNREVSPNFLEYVVRLADGRVLTGLIASETDSGLTLRRAQNQQDNILRSEIDDIASSGKSLMPEGLEQKITPQEMADLIAYLKQN